MSFMILCGFYTILYHNIIILNGINTISSASHESYQCDHSQETHQTWTSVEPYDGCRLTRIPRRLRRLTPGAYFTHNALIKLILGKGNKNKKTLRNEKQLTITQNSLGPMPPNNIRGKITRASDLVNRSINYPTSKEQYDSPD